MVSSIQVARLLAHCVPIGSLAELLFSFCMWSVLEFFLQMVDAITGKVISSMVIVSALKVHCNTLVGNSDFRLFLRPPLEAELQFRFRFRRIRSNFFLEFRC
jgi:hypothetical protein